MGVAAGITYFVKDKRGIKTTVAGVKNRTFVDVTLYSQGTYRDDPVNVLNITALDNADSGDAATGGGISLYSGNAKAINNAGTPSSTPAVYASDLITHTSPRHEAVKRTEIRLWSGKTGSQSCTTVSSSTSVTTASTDNFCVGQGVSGTGIPEGATIQSITNATTFVISSAATASASNSLTFDDGDLLHSIWHDELSSMSIATFTRI